MAVDRDGEPDNAPAPASPLLELDLGEARRGAPIPGPVPRRLRLPGWALGLAAGALAGGLAVHLLDGGSAAPAPTEQHLRVAFGALPSNVEEQLDHGLAVLDVFAVVVNDGTAPLTLEAVHVTGPGAALVDPGPRWAPLELPMVVRPGEERDLPLAITSDCAVAVRPLPVVSLVVRDAAGAVRDQSAPVPDLARLWGQTLIDGPCPDLRPRPGTSFPP